MIQINDNMAVYSTAELYDAGFIVRNVLNPAENHKQIGVLIYDDALELVQEMLEDSTPKHCDIRMITCKFVSDSEDTSTQRLRGAELQRVVRRSNDKIVCRFDGAVTISPVDNVFETDDTLFITYYVHVIKDTTPGSRPLTPNLYRFKWGLLTEVERRDPGTNLIHSYNDQPGRIIYKHVSRSSDVDFSVVHSVEYYNHNVLHRHYKPAIVTYDPVNAGIEYMYYKDGTDVTANVSGAEIDDAGTIDSFVWETL